MTTANKRIISNALQASGRDMALFWELVATGYATRIAALEEALKATLPLVEAAAAFDKEPWTGESQHLVDQVRSALTPERDK